MPRVKSVLQLRERLMHVAQCEIWSLEGDVCSPQGSSEGDSRSLEGDLNAQDELVTQRMTFSAHRGT